ncbi:uncharacterized protein [Chironomus tepperi]|uniref:uncharacterized protein n=1 Tax=Chironomus tepperi TaxID=113505 RepID=UPI00391F2934
MFKTPKIMQKYKFCYTDWKEIDDDSSPTPLDRFLYFLKSRGNYILNLEVSIVDYTVGRKCLIQILSFLPNVERLEYFVMEPKSWSRNAKKLKCGDYEQPDNIPNLLKLKHLRVTHKFLNFFMGKVTTLNYFAIGESQGGTDQTTNIIQFMNQQENLEKFGLVNADYELKDYTMDVSSAYNFKIKKFRADRECENFREFCAKIADDVEDMQIYMQPNMPFYDSLQKFKNLKKLRLPLKHSEDFFLSDYTGWELPNVEELEVCFEAKLSKIFSRFPKVKHFQCRQLLNDTGVFETIETISVDAFDSSLLYYVHMPNWKTLIINSPVDEIGWTIIAARLTNIHIKLLKGFKN